MAADELALLFRLRGDASGLKTATAEARAAIGQIKQTFGPELAQTVSTTNKAFNEVGANLGALTQRIPVVGVAISRLTDLLRNVGIEGKTTERAVSGIANSISTIAQASGKSIPQVAQFLTRFTQLKTASDKNTEAFKFFGGSVDLIGNKTAKFLPELEKASTTLASVSAESAAAGSSIAAMAGPIGVAVIAVAALVAGLGLAAREMFDLSKRTAEFQGRMQDLSQSTGLAVETLSTLEVAAKTTGGSLDSVAASMGIFQRQLDEAQDPLSKAAGNFEQLGVTVEDTESTLRATLAALAAMPEGFQQTTLALELFGRGGKQVLAILKETNGDLDAFQEKLREAGVLITGDAARAADKFNDELALLEFQYRASSAALAKEMIPALIDAIDATGDLLRSSRPLLDFLGTLTGIAARTASQALKGLSLTVAALTGDYKTLAESIKEANEQQSIFRKDNLQAIPSLNVPSPSPVGLPQGSAAQVAREAAQLADTVVAAAQRAAKETNQALNQAFEQGRINRTQQANSIIADNARILDAEKKRVAAELQLEEDKFKQIQNRADLAQSEREQLLSDSAGKVRKLQQQELDAQSLFDTTARELRARAAKERADSLRNQERNNTDILTRELDRRIGLIERAIQDGVQSEIDGLKAIEQVERERIQVRRESLQEEKRIGFLTIENRKDIDKQIDGLNKEADRLEDDQRLRREQRQREHAGRLRQLKLDEIQLLLDLERIAGESAIASLEAQAALRIRTEESASREILRIRLQLLDDELEALRAQRQAAGGIVNTEERTQAQAELNARIRLLQAERLAVEAQGSRDLDEARQQDLRNEREYADELEEIQQRTADIQRDTAQEIIRLMRLHFASRKDIIRAQRELDLQEERDRHQRAIETIRAQQGENNEQIGILEQRLESLRVGTTEEIEEHDRLIQSLERLRAKRAELGAQAEAEGALSSTITRSIKTEATTEEDAADPLGRIGLARDQLREFAAELESTIVPLNELLADSFASVSDAIGQTVANWVLLGETGPAVMRKILAQALASLAAEAAVNAIKELALGFGSLFFNPAESAAHFTSAALWGSIAGGAALAGRGVAGDLFKSKPGTSSSTGDGRGGSNQLDPLAFNRNQPERRMVVEFRAAGDQMSQAFTAVVLSDIDNAGPIREALANDGRFS